MHWWTNPSPVSPIMRLISLAMATQKKGHVTQPLRSKSTNSKPNKPLARTLATGVSHKSRSDSSIINGLRTLSINDRSNATTPASTKIRQSPIARRISSASSRCQSLEDIARYILAKKAKNIVIMAGAGISTSSGIPDFRSPGTGLYDNLKQYNIPYPEAIFDIDYFTYKPKPFFTLAKELYPSGKYKPNYIHYFCRMLHEKGLLLRMYTQNIDGFERLAGIPPSKLVEAHGTFATATCTGCRKTYPGEEIKEDIFNNKVPYCRNRRSCPGVIKPDIIFFGEDLPRRFWYYLRDFPQADLLIVMGTSLEVEPFAGIVDCTRFNTPRVLLNMKAVGPFKNKKRSSDVVVQGDLLESVQRFANILGWKREMNDLIFNENQKVPEFGANAASPQTADDSKRETPPSVTENGASNSSSQTMQESRTTGLPPAGKQTTKPNSQNGTNGTNSQSRQYHTFSAKGRLQNPKPPIALFRGRQTVKNNGNDNKTGVRLPQLNKYSSQRFSAYQDALMQLKLRQRYGPGAASSSSSEDTSEESEESSSESDSDD